MGYYKILHFKTKPMRAKHLIVAGMLSLNLFLAGCAPKLDDNAVLGKKPSLESLQRLQSGNATQPHKTSNLRTQALRDTALSLGARGGLAWRADQINQLLTKQESYLNRIFRFHSLMLDKNVLPPVLIEARNTLNLSGNDSIRIAERNYHILKQARFVTGAPSWRDYLWLHYTPPEKPNRTLLPRNTSERMMWREFIEEGWQAGLQQADIIYQENLGRLKRDFEGMIRYRSLLAKNMVSPPFVASMDMGVTGGGDNLTVHDRVLRITSFPALQAESTEWKTEITPHE